MLSSASERSPEGQLLRAIVLMALVVRFVAAPLVMDTATAKTADGRPLFAYCTSTGLSYLELLPDGTMVPTDEVPAEAPKKDDCTACHVMCDGKSFAKASADFHIPVQDVISLYAARFDVAPAQSNRSSYAPRAPPFRA